MISWNLILHQLLYDPKDPVLFNSVFFLYFFAIFIVFYLLTAKNRTMRILVYTLFSLYFFYKACGYYVGLVVLSAIVDYNLSHIIHRSQNKGTKKALLLVSIILNVDMLVYFKYTNFMISIINDLSHGHISALHILLPIGISFYTFENLSYTIDVYTEKIKPEKSFLDYLFFLSFFPKLMMGPIVRADDFLPQIHKPYYLKKEDIGKGFYLIVAGLFKKVVISDYINQNFVQYIFDDPSKHTGIECLLGVLGYALVIYCDFSGYSDMAIGIARWTGFKIPANFDSPYQSKNITEFWRRWHISLSSWLRDYIYIPLGGNRKGVVRQYINLGLTMLIGGLWHGASWNFILWGAMHGAALAVDKLRMSAMKKIGWNTNKGFMGVLGILVTFAFVCFCWIFFRANTFHDSGVVLHQIFYDFQGNILPDLFKDYSMVFYVMILGFVLHFIPHSFEIKTEQTLAKIPIAAYIIVLVVFILGLAQVKSSEPIMPVYFQF